MSVGRQIKCAVKRFVNYFGVDNLSWLGYARHGANETPDSVLGTWAAPAGTPRSDVDRNLYTLRKRSRDLRMGSSFISAILDAKRAGVVGRGIHLDSQLDAEVLGVDDKTASALERKIQSAWGRWARRAGRNGEALTEILSLAYYSSILSGDCFVRVTLSGNNLRLSIIEGDAIQTPPEKLGDPRVQMGVQFANVNDYPLYYFVGRLPAYAVSYDCALEFDRYPHARHGFQSPLGEWNAPKGGLLHVHTAFERPGQVRGIPIASCMMGDLKQLDRYVQAELDASVVAAKFTAFIEHPDTDITPEEFGAFEAESPTDAAGPSSPEYAASGQNSLAYLGNGAIVDLENGAKVNTANPGRPNTAFGGFVDAMQSRISAALQIPVEVATKKCSSSYSAARAAFLDADRSFSIDRALLVRQLLQPVFEMWLDINADRLGLGGYYDDPDIREAYRCAEWIGEQVPSIDPVKEVQAAKLRVDLCASTLARESRELTGTDISSNIRQRGFEESMMRASGLVKDNNGNPVQFSNQEEE